MGSKLFVGNLAYETTSDDLRALFAEVGTCESATVVTDRDGNVRFTAAGIPTVSDLRKLLSDQE